MISRLIPFARKYKTATLIGPLLIILEVLIEVRIPLMMARIVDIGIPSKDINYVLKTGGLMVLMALLSLACGIVASYFSSIASMGFGSEIRRVLFDKIQGFSFSNTDKFSTASLVMRLTTDISNVQMAFMMIIRIMVRAPVMLLFATIMATRINSSLVSVFLIAIPFLAVVLGLIMYFAFPRFRAMFIKYDAMNASVQENLVAIRVVKSFVRASHEKKKFKEANDNQMSAAIEAEKIVQVNLPVMQLTMYACIVAILWFGGNMVITRTMKTGELISFISYVSQILIQLIMLSMVFVNVIISRASATRIIEVLDEKIAVTDDDIVSPASVPDGSIIFEDVSFSYNPEADEKVLEHIDLTIKSGDTVGIIGGTGSGKTSLVHLIPRLYDVTDGRILVGGRDVRNYRIEDLRSEVSMVLQKNVLFSGTIKDNLKWGNEDASDEEIEDACQTAQAHDFIMSFPDGYNTHLGQGGVNVSGGQKQRLTIARALLKKPKILILDDSTSAVDTRTDSRIRSALKEKRNNTTTIIIAQRITSVSEADQIIVMDDGKIDGIGTHDELLTGNRIYREVYESQQKGVDQECREEI